MNSGLDLPEHCTQPNPAANPEFAGVGEPRVGRVLWNLAVRPYDTFIRLWNWKAALLSALTRGPLFLLTTAAHGWRRASIAMLVEALFRAGAAGFLAAATQALRNARPRWLAFIFTLAGLPVLALILDGAMHLAVRTPNLVAGMLLSSLLTALASLYDWYIMRRGTMLVGPEGSSFWSDLKLLPSLTAGFVLAPVVFAWRCTRSWIIPAETE